MTSPLSDTLALRIAGMSLERDGFTENEFTGNDVDDRSLWSGRLSLTWDAGDDTQVNFMYSKFEEDDNRVRSQKQACVNDPTGRLGCLPGAPKYENINTAGTVGGALVNTIGGLNTIVSGYLGQYGLATNQMNYAALGLNAISGAAFFPAQDYIGDTNPDDVRKVNMDTKPLYETSEETFQLHFSHDFGDMQLYYSGGYAETDVMSVEDYEKGVSNADWTAALNTLAQLGSVPALPGAMLPDIVGALAPTYGAGTATTVGLLITDAATGIPGVGLWAGNPALAGLANGVQVLNPDDNSYSTWYRNGGLDESSNDNKQWTHEIRLQSSFDGPLNFLVGGFYLEFDNTNAYIVRASGLAFPGQHLLIDPRVYPAPYGDPDNPRSESNPYMQGYPNDSRVYKLDAKAIFGEVYWDVTDSLRLTFGGRYTEEKKEGKQRTIYVTFADLPPVQPNNAFFEPVFEQEEFSWKVNATWNMSDNTMMYATVSSSFKSGGFTQRVFPPIVPPFTAPPGTPDIDLIPTYEPEFVEVLEAGFKLDLLDGRLRLNGAIFQTDYEELQVQVFNSVAPVTQNIGEASIDGFEVELFASPAEGWFIEGSLSLLNAEYDSIDTANTLILQSNEFERVPETTASVGLSKELDLADVGTLLLRADWSYRSETYNDAYNTPLLETDSYSLVDASVRWTNTGGDWTVILAGTNLSDEQYLVTGVYGTAFQSLEGVYNRGRQWRVEVRKAF